MMPGQPDASPPAGGRIPVVMRTVLGTLAGAALFAMMSLTFVDVIGRKFLGASVTGGVEVTELLMTLLIYSALPLASLAGEHVVFDLLDGVLAPRVKAWQSVLSNLISAGLVSVAAWFVFQRAGRTLEMGDTTAQLQIGIAPFHYFAATMLVLSALMHLYLAVMRRPRA